MTVTAKATSATQPRLQRSWRRFPAGSFARHYAEMLLAMMIGMFVLGAALAVPLSAVGIEVSSWQTEAPELMLLGMAFTMSVPMVAWMRYRGHGWGPAWEMTAAMFVPSFAAIGLLWGGLVEEPDSLLAIQHVAMLFGMLAAMLIRSSEYTRH